MSAQLHDSETSKLIDKSRAVPLHTRSSSFIVAKSNTHEVLLIVQRCAMMSLQLLCQFGSPVIAMIFVGQLPDSAVYLSGVGLSRTFVNVTGTAMAWGFTTSLFTLLPQSIGAGQTALSSLHIQRAFYVVTIVASLLSIIQFFAGDIMIAIGEPASLKPIINTYCRYLVPYIFLTGYGAILSRLGQSLDLNLGLTYCSIVMLLSSPLLCWLFMYRLAFGYKGAAVAQCCVLAVFCAAQLALFVSKGYGHFFIPHPWNRVWTRKGMMHYINLAIPGLFQSAFQWIIEEMAVILAGFVVEPTISLSTTVILTNVFMVVMPFAIGICNATNLRVGKYIGRGSVMDAKRSAVYGVTIAIVLLVVWSVILLCGRNAIPKIYTNDKDTIELTSHIMFMMVVYAMGCFIMMTVGGIYRGLGFQKIAAYVVFVSYWIIAWPISMVVLFGLDVKQDLRYGVMTIWSGLALGNILASVGTVVYLLCFVDWNEAVQQSNNRIKCTMKEYESTQTNEIKSKVIN